MSTFHIKKYKLVVKFIELLVKIFRFLFGTFIIL